MEWNEIVNLWLTYLHGKFAGYAFFGCSWLWNCINHSWLFVSQKIFEPSEQVWKFAESEKQKKVNFSFIQDSIGEINSTLYNAGSHTAGRPRGPDFEKDKQYFTIR